MIKTWSYIEEYKIYRKKILNSIDKTLKSGNLFFGKQLNDFEKKFLKLNRSKYGVAVGTGTDALIISLKVLGIGNNGNDEVITVSNTAIPTVSAIKSAGAKAVLTGGLGSTYRVKDIDYDTRTDTLHAASQYGTSEFRRLVRINNTTNPASLVSAQGGMVSEINF